MKFRTIDLWLPPLLAGAFLVLGLMISGPNRAGTAVEIDGIRGWKAVGYLVPYLMIFAGEPVERHWGRFCRRRRPL